METKKHRWILYLISITIIITVTVQFYWNFKNYQQNKQRIKNEIQLSLDNAIESYFADLSKKKHITIIEADKIGNTSKVDLLQKLLKPNIKETLSDSLSNTTSNYQKKIDLFLNELRQQNNPKLDTSFKHITIITPYEIANTSKIGQLQKLLKPNTATNKKSDFFSDSYLDIISDNEKDFDIFLKEFTQKNNHKLDASFKKKYSGKKTIDSLNLIENLKTILIAIQNDSINHQKIDTLLKNQLHEKKIALNYSFKLYKNDTLYSSYKSLSAKNTQEITSKSTFLASDKYFKMRYINPSFSTLKRSFYGILLSSLLSLAVIFSLFYLLNTINKQKELAEIKNDLISNITHEFKTPITTVSSALEAINSFNVINDIEKTKKYVSISEQQINKLHIMVEKLLETATLDNEKLLLQKEKINIVNFIKTITQKHQFTTSNKTVYFSSNKDSLPIKIDEFHFENAISNLIDNAIKYGGNKIDINVIKLLNTIEIKVIDNGGNIEKNQQEKIFEQFYRIPKGNTHDVKGFGIGLYYTKKIIEKHGGEISVKSNKVATEFKISLPYE